MFSIRNKRRRKQTGGDAIQAKRRKPGRPMKSVQELSAPKSILNAQLLELQKQGRLSTQPSKKAVSHLEQLPYELIQQIFFECFEVNLPRASSSIAQALSTESTYKALILFAYFDDDHQSPVETAVFLPVVYRPLRIAQRIRLQQDILTCGWFTLERIKASLPVLSRLAMVQAWYKERRYAEMEGDLAADRYTLQVDESLGLYDRTAKVQEVAHLPNLDDQYKLEEHFFAKSDIGYVYGSRSDPANGVTLFAWSLPRIITWTTNVQVDRGTGHRELVKQTALRTSCLAARVLPDWLLKGNPWTKEKVELLQLLRQGFRYIHDASELKASADAVFEGMYSAIRELNTEALLTLLELHNSIFRGPMPTDPNSLYITHIDVNDDDNNGGSAATNMIHESLFPLPVGLFHLATKAGSQSSKLMSLLIRGGVDSIPNDDEVLTAWAIRKQAAGDKIARWLLNHMSSTPDYTRASMSSFFDQGGLSFGQIAEDNSFPYLIRPFWEELHYLVPDIHLQN